MRLFRSKSIYRLLVPALLLVTLSLVFIPTLSVSATDFNPGCDVAQLVADLATAGSNSQPDTINLAAGCTYTLTSTLTVNADSGNLLTINGNGATLSGNDAVRVLTINTGANIAISNVTISGGWNMDSGGGILNYGTVTLTNTIVNDNSAFSGGGGIRNEGTMTLNYSTVSNNSIISSAGGGIRNEGTMTLNNSTVSGNSASGFGGGGIANGSTMTLNNSTISGNSATIGDGGGISHYDGMMTLNNSTISGNSAFFAGGGIYSYGGTMILTNSVIDGNTAPQGGGIYNEGTLTVTNTAISNNQAPQGTNSDGEGGGIYNSSSGTLTLNSSTLYANDSFAVGGGISNAGILTLNSSTITANMSNYGAGIANLASPASATVTNSTISGNHGTANAGGISNESDLFVYNSTINGNFHAGVVSDGGAQTIVNTIISNNAGGDCENYGGTFSFQNTLIEDGSCGLPVGSNGNLTGDPNLGTITGIPGYHPLNPGSIAINAGSNALIPAGVTTDQPGNPRITGGIVDMGSFESSFVPTNTPTRTPTRTNTNTPTLTPPAPDLNIISNGTFSAGLTNWAFSGTTQQVSSGALQIAPTTPGGSFYQFVNFNSAGEIFEVNFRAGNSSATAKTLNLMVRDADWSPLYNCVFGIPAYSPFQNYRMRFDTSDSFIPMVLQGALSGDSSMGVLIDDITMVRKTGLTVPSTECTVAPPPNVDLVYDGGFNQGTANWAAFNAAMQVVNIGGSNGNIMELARWNGTPNGGFYQYNPYSAPANGVLQFNFQIGNQSNTARVINMLVRNPDWTDLHSCFITVPANTPLTSLQIKLKTSVAWSNIVIQGWIQVGDYTGTPPLPFRFDNLSLQYLPAGSSGTTECPAPIPMPQRATATLTPSPSATNAGEGSATPSMTATSTETATASATSTDTLVPSATATALPSATAAAILTETATDVPTVEPPIATLTPSPSPTNTGEGSPTLEPPSGTPLPPTNTAEPLPEETQSP